MATRAVGLAVIRGPATLNDDYTQDFFAALTQGAWRSARQVVPLVLELSRPSSVIDVGCGVGIWLSVFKELGIKDCMGIDGDYVDRSSLEILLDEFQPFDLENSLALGRTFDLVVSLEVAEHLPEECAETFVDSLTRLGDVILFSAAIPLQGGTHHVNEQWPDYWATHFLNRGYAPIDCLRKRFWRNDDVEWWYVQNILFFVKKSSLSNYPHLSTGYYDAALDQLSLVHPRLYTTKTKGLQDDIVALERHAAELQELNSQLQKKWRSSTSKDQPGKF